ncbi:MAG: universal stress protein [Nitrosopumilus sp.]|nr:universal stress protein [Nitrosopumilus sp.]MDC4231612.1 universal stress protein [Nitrosopumilus sp.]
MTKTFEHILVPYNGSAGSEKAFRKAISMASSINAKITILTCLEERPTFGFFKTKTSKQEFEKERNLIEKQHLKLEKFAKEHDVLCSSKVAKNGLPSTKILEFAKQHNVDLIITTRTKLSSRYEKQHYHSTVENMFRNASCPILIL